MSATVDSVLLFPGQGAFRDGDLTRFAAERPELFEVFDEIDRTARELGAEPPSAHLLATPIPLAELIHEAPDIVQLGIYGSSIALWRMLGDTGKHFGVMMGHSSGEIAALVAAGAFTVREGAEIVVHRSAVLSRVPRPAGGMLMLTCTAEHARAVLEAVANPLLAVAVRNSSQQVVVAGPPQPLETVAQVAASLGIGSRLLPAAYPFHSPVLATAAAEFAGRIRHIEARPLRAMVFSPILGRFHRAGDALTEHIATALVAPVAFDQALQRLHEAGARTFVECAVAGPLRRIVTQQLPAADVLSAADYVSTKAVPAVDARAPAPVIASTAREPEPRRRALAAVPQPAPPQPAPPQPAPPQPAPPQPAPPQPAPPQPAPAAPGGLAPAGVAVGGGREQLFAELVDMYAQALEYPAEVFTAEVKLEEDLGIDSVKQTELMARAAEHYGLPEPTPDFQLDHYDTMGKLVDYVWAQRRSAGTSAPLPAPPPELAPAELAPPGLAPAGVAVGSGREQLFAELVDMYAQALEYPAEVFTAEVKLEEDLGIDSVKQTELMARAAEHYGLPEPTPDFQLDHYDTMGKLVDYVWAQQSVATSLS